MSSAPLAHVLRHIRKLAGARSGGELTDGQLLERFSAQRDEAAFATLVDRHGPMVLGVCRRVLGNVHDADDAFQATFLVLARRAGSIHWHDTVGNWLYGVAQRTARKLKATGRRREKERLAIDMPHSRGDGPLDEVLRQELAALLDEELGRLPQKYRTPLVLCYLEGKTNEEAARELGWAAGSMSRHLARAREVLRKRLTHRGVSLSTGLFMAALVEGAFSAPVPAALREGTVRAALLFTAGMGPVAGVVSTEIIALTEGVLRAMFLTKLKIAATLLLAVTAIGMGAGGIWHQTAAAKRPADAPKKDQTAEGSAAGVPLPNDAKGKTDSRQAATAYQLRAKMAQRIDLEKGIDKNTPLSDALEFLGETYGVKIIFDRKGLEAIGVQNAEEQPVSMPKMRDVPLANVLSLLLRQVRGEGGEGGNATYLVKSSYIEVTSEVRTRPELWVGANRQHAVTVDAEFSQTTLDRALRELADKSGINVILDTRLLEKASKTTVAATLSNVPLDTAVRLLADMAELKAVAIDNVLYVTTKANVEALQADHEKLRAMAREAGKEPLPAPAESPPKKADESTPAKK